MQFREAFEGGDHQGEETISFCAIECLDGMYFFLSVLVLDLSISLHRPFIKSDCSAVLADCWLDKPSVHAFAIPCDLPQLCCMLLVMFSCPEHSTRHVSQCPPLGESHLLSGHLVFPPVQGDISQPPCKGYVSEAGLDGIGGAK